MHIIGLNSVRIKDIDNIRLSVNQKLNPENKSKYGQFMTPSSIADFMAGLFRQDNEGASTGAKLLDCGAGIGSLTISAVNKLEHIAHLDLWEIDPIMQDHLVLNMQKLDVPSTIYKADFIFDAVETLLSKSEEKYTHAILNPPYKKINSNSEYRKALRKVGIETVNLYSAFVALAIKLTKKGGQVVAIIPRSFCNGPYYKSFRELLLLECTIEHIHLFQSRDQAFKDDGVLQENIIIKLVKGTKQGKVTISQSKNADFNDYSEESFDFESVVKPGDAELFIRLPTNKDIDERLFEASLSEIGLNVSTGPVVDFRIKDLLERQPQGDTVPLLYPHHFEEGRFVYPKEHKKPNAIRVSSDSQKWLMPNDGYYVIVKRFSAKEEKRRVVAYVVDPNDIGKDNQWIGFENHWNVFHVNKHGFDKTTATGLACFLNSTMLDDYFRTFSGHTQVNATDLKNMLYPSLKKLHELGKNYQMGMGQVQVDALLEFASK